MISLQAYLMGREAEFPPTPEMLADANSLLQRVESLFYDLGIELTDDDLSSGYRPGRFNVMAGGSANSAHLKCVAIDIKDPNKKFAKAVLQNPQLLDRHGLYLEDPKYCPTWLHLQTRKTRNRVFKPSEKLCQKQKLKLKNLKVLKKH